ncbi:allophanate hydrolase [Gilvimarinus sp. 1_MG-2023]|uniref:allophanate hydrolase n=1 Tax=Gilvimarinus sp. 1_MG-2023 TaxID=3062638 RepID=UPI0026E30E86|nr:allophanate hydrolase [Gilvimarinus sp. 1_MG-2023]MDO6746439.1 allophanate hydrolase [Gilvimarinus sp. 1_MG-2023]
MSTPTLTRHSLHLAYRDGRLTPRALLAEITKRCEALTDHNIWIYRLSAAELEPYLQALEGQSPDSLPLYGLPFAIKDNIDLKGVPTSAACEAFTYTPPHSATVVQALIDAGAIPVGKTNLDQFATGLVGTRSPWGACKNSADPNMISGGSSSGSAVAVAKGLACFSLGTDTAGSGRVPACFNNLVGLKPSIGLLSATGMVPACRSLDCMTVFALNTDDAHAALSVAEGDDESDAYSRVNPFANSARHYGRQSGPLRLGVMSAEQLAFFGHEGYQSAYQSSLSAIEKLADIELIEVDMSAFLSAAKLLYEGPWVAERYLACSPLIEEHPNALLPVTKAIISAGAAPSARDGFTAQYRLKALRKEAQRVLDSVDALLTPTAPRPFSIAELEANPIELNSQLGYYTNYMNLFDLCGLALPTAFTEQGFPFGLTLVAEAFSDRKLLSIGNRLQQSFALPLGANKNAFEALSDKPAGGAERIDLVVCGAHLNGQPLNWQLRERAATLQRCTQSAPEYQLYALPGGPPLRPAMVLAEEGQGCAIEVEVWSMPVAELGSFVAGIAAPLGIGKVRLADGTQCAGFICEQSGIEGAIDISQFGGWRAYLGSS